MRKLIFNDKYSGEDGELQDSGKIDTIHNHIFFYSEVNESNAASLIVELHKLNSSIWADMPLWLHIQSAGGVAFVGFSIADNIIAFCQKRPIFSVIDGYCASAAVLVAVACTRRYIMPNAYVMLHSLSSAVWGRLDEIKDEVNLMDSIMDRMVNFYANRCSASVDEIKKLLGRETWLNADECLKLGLVDAIYGKEF